ncbi:Phage protein [Brachybacterium faecium]|nr:Phage protein [Brachybacterium faecium]
MDLNEYLKGIVSLVTAITVVGGALIWIYKKLVSDPDKRMAERIQRENSESLKKTVQPLTQSIELLNNNLKQSEKDREQLNKKVNLHDNILNNHETRITVLEKLKKERQENES